MKKNVILGVYYELVPNISVHANLHRNVLNVCHWLESILKFDDITPVLFYDNFPLDFIISYSKLGVIFKKTTCPANICPNNYRFFQFSKFVNENENQIEKCFITDVTDVLLLENPFPHIENGIVYCGDEEEIVNGLVTGKKKLNNVYMFDQYTDSGSKILVDYVADFYEHGEKPFLNCGIIGGDVITMKKLLNESKKYLNIYPPFEMVYINYYIYCKKNPCIHGKPVNTVFCLNQYEGAWFKHK